MNTIKDFIDKKKIEDVLLIGYYGGGNLGDELLLEVFLNLFKDSGTKKLKFYYRDPKNYSRFHHNFGYTLINPTNKIDFFLSIINSKNIVIGGGGIWGLDVNVNILLLSVILFLARYIFFKKVYLLGVGYYKSTNLLGHIGAFFAALASNYIVVRDKESLNNFKKFKNKSLILLDKDAAFNLRTINESHYIKDKEAIEKIINVPNNNLIIIVLRRFKEGRGEDYKELIKKLVVKHQDKKFLLMLFEPRAVDPEGYRYIETIHNTFENTQIIDFSFNPIGFSVFLKANNRTILVIAPQYHAQILAYINGIRFFPIIYDNKNIELLNEIGIAGKELRSLTFYDLQQFI